MLTRHALVDNAAKDDMLQLLGDGHGLFAQVQDETLLTRRKEAAAAEKLARRLRVDLAKAAARAAVARTKRVEAAARQANKAQQLARRMWGLVARSAARAASVRTKRLEAAARQAADTAQRRSMAAGRMQARHVRSQHGRQGESDGEDDGRRR